MKKLNIKKTVADSFGFPGEYMTDMCKISISDFNVFELINYKCIVEYSDNLLRLNTKEKIITLKGEFLNIDNITDDEIKISGKIHSIDFE